jgi:Ser/Thr protein kinase RdoA (MazF antagonist)
MRILRERLAQVGGARPELHEPVGRILARCERWASALPKSDSVVTHRDFYPDQLIVDGNRICLLDLDLCCLAPCGLDLGNFCAHLTEWSLRASGDPTYLEGCESAAREQFLRAQSRAASITSETLQCWKRLSLARHVYISTLFADRQAFTERLIELTLKL